MRYKLDFSGREAAAARDARAAAADGELEREWGAQRFGPMPREEWAADMRSAQERRRSNRRSELTWLAGSGAVLGAALGIDAGTSALLDWSIVPNTWYGWAKSTIVDGAGIVGAVTAAVKSEQCGTGARNASETIGNLQRTDIAPEELPPSAEIDLPPPETEGSIDSNGLDLFEDGLDLFEDYH